VLLNLSAGNLHRIVAVPRDGGATVRPLLTLTLIPWYLDMALDGSIYLEQIDQPAEVLRFRPRAESRSRWPRRRLSATDRSRSLRTTR
jgi:hypothetical protein